MPHHVIGWKILRNVNGEENVLEKKSVRFFRELCGMSTSFTTSGCLNVLHVVSLTLYI